ncbi:hypothetical protein FLONG3_6156 [Fusarium longipes]|uniref:Uncharacterized protein n=1 Tax=Fusarium longipes TaxID=694270 RepID=A0A395SP65_9HYPO|nr:hypothetical protein FLONG3_6156 [Fusarium longipes]
MCESNKKRIVNNVIRRLWPVDPEAAVHLKVSLAGMQYINSESKADKHVCRQRYQNETDYIKDIMLSIVKNIGYAMNELDLRDEKAVSLNRCKYDLARAVDDHNRITGDGYDRTFRVRLNCTVKELKAVDDGNDDPSDGTKQNGEPMMEVTLRFPAREYNESPHSPMPGWDNVFFMMKEL